MSASFPSLFAVVEYKDAWVKDFLIGRWMERIGTPFSLDTLMTRKWMRF